MIHLIMIVRTKETKLLKPYAYDVMHKNTMFIITMKIKSTLALCRILFLLIIVLILWPARMETVLVAEMDKFGVKIHDVRLIALGVPFRMITISISIWS